MNTGADAFYVSDFLRSNLLRGERKWKASLQASQTLGGGRCVEAGPLREKGQDHVCFAMGTELLHQYKALLDYDAHCLTLTLGGRQLMVNIGKD